MTALINAPGLFFFALIAGPGIVLLLNHLSIKRTPVTQPQSDDRFDERYWSRFFYWDDFNDIEFFFPATERPLVKTDAQRESTAPMSGAERKPPRSVAGGTL